MNAFVKAAPGTKKIAAPQGALIFGVWGSRVCRLLLAGVFLHSGVLKVWDLPSFWNALQSYLFLPHGVMAVALYTVPPAEIVLGFAMLTAFYAAASRMIFALMIIFMAVLCMAAARGIDITCGCFGGDEMATNVSLLILRDGVIAAIALLLPVRRKVPTQE